MTQKLIFAAMAAFLCVILLPGCGGGSQEAPAVPAAQEATGFMIEDDE